MQVRFSAPAINKVLILWSNRYLAPLISAMIRFRIVFPLFILCVFSFLSACQHEPDELSEPETILTLQVGPEAFLGGENWIFATNDNGDVLDVKPFAVDETVTLSSAKRVDKINVTFFKTALDRGIRYTTFTTYSAIAKGTTWSMGASVYLDPQPVGVATFKVSDYEGLPGMLKFSNSEWYSNDPSVTSGDELVVGVPLRKAGDVLLSGYRSGVPVYNWAKGVQVGDVVERNFLTDFEAFPHQVKLDFEGTSDGTVIGRTLENPYGTVLISSNDVVGTKWQTDPPVIGYVDGFDSYEISVWNTRTNGAVNYYHVGRPDLSFSIPTFTFSANNTDMLDFSFNFSLPHTYYSADWRYYDGMQFAEWRATAPSGQAPKGFAIPNEIAAKYGALDLSKFEYWGVRFKQVIEGKSKSYPEAVSRIVANKADGDQTYYDYVPW
jgi:hypothetical protein